MEGELIDGRGTSQPFGLLYICPISPPPPPPPSPSDILIIKESTINNQGINQ